MTSQTILAYSPSIISNKSPGPVTNSKPPIVYRTRFYYNLCGTDGSDREKLCQTIKLTLLSLISGVILIIVSAITLAQNVRKLEANTILGENVQFSIEIGEVIHYIQIERGTTALFVSAKGDPYLFPRLHAQYEKTDLALSKLSKWSSKSTPPFFRSRDAFHEKIREFRYALVPENATLQEVISFYTDHNSIFIDMIAESTNANTDVPFWTEEVAYLMCIVSKEQAGIERALGSTYFARGLFPTADLLWYVEKQTLGMSYLTQCTKYSPFVDDMLDNMFINSTLETNLGNMRETIRLNENIVPTVVTGEIWFDNMTSYINILKIVLDELALRIVEETNDQSMNYRNELLISALELGIALILSPVVALMVKNIADKIQAFTLQLKNKTDELEAERKRTERLLHELLPRTVAQTLLSEGHVPPEQFNSATIMFTDIVSFTSISSRSTPMQVVNMLNKLYVAIDNQIENFDVYKIETIGDAYMVASGLPRRNGERHVSEIAKLSLKLLDTVSNLSIDHLEDEKFKLRLGFNTGPCVTGIVGLKMPRYCVYGDTVNIASRMESTGLPLKIQLSESSATILRRQKYHYAITERGLLEVKGKGQMRTFWLESYSEDDCEVKSVGCTSF